MTILFFFLAYIQVKAEEKNTQGLIVGIQNWDKTIVEAGYLFGRKIEWVESKSIKGYGGLGLGLELGNSASNDSPLLGLKVAYTINMFISFGGSVIYYTDFSTWGLRFRPEIGVSMFGVRIVYGRNSTMLKPNFSGINNNVMSVTLFIPM
ncbi:MAG: hypothetical protein ACK5C0_12035 [Candidatus Kapaibacterium sp.]|jgi:hypothetical protein